MLLLHVECDSLVVPITGVTALIRQQPMLTTESVDGGSGRRVAVDNRMSTPILCCLQINQHTDVVIRPKLHY